ncbi:right-handed parallel beta-helix repeat-containing protein [Pseudonocardia spinosispora]|uniref:right-handed parallel beta-helix repeat-containing protein n=1 Tax=Pseudonocardia spinosispora TaxID=103441 RepID=UPI00146FADE6|nr:right-handed parallel beta-helix repeat-containing protein [Pseudonocardia spinosispora]
MLLPATPLPDDSSTAFQDPEPQARSSAVTSAPPSAAQTPTVQPRAAAPGWTNPIRPVAEIEPAAPVVADTSCTGVTRPVRDGPSLIEALNGARAGDVIQLADGTYKGNFTATAQGTADRPITLCGTRNAVLGGTGGYGLHLDGASHWRLAGFTIRGGAKGLMLDRAQSNLVEGLLIEQTGEEGLHLRMGSSDNLVRGNEVRLTGRTSAEYGEGIYIGSAQKNWSKFGDGRGGPDRSDRNVIELNTVTDTVAENVDIKEGTTGGILRGNTFSGNALAGGFADSWVDIKGNSWTIADNVGTDTPADGFQVHEIVSGWGVDNRFDNNSATLRATGYAINVTKNPQRNVVSCTNRVTGGQGLSNVACTGAGV